MCGGSSDRPSTAAEGQSASGEGGGEAGSKITGRHADGSGAEAGKNTDVDGCGRGAARVRRSGREGVFAMRGAGG